MSFSRSAYLWVIVTTVVLFAPFVVGAQMVYWGTPLLQFYPWRYTALEAVRAGFWPLWNPWVGNGAPLLANYQSALLYPPNWLALVAPLDLASNWLLVAHVIWAGVGMVTLARWLGYAPLGQTVAGLAFGLSQYVVARASFYSINAAVAWLPWVIWAADQVWASQSGAERAGRVWRLAGCLALQLLAGHAQTTWYTGLLLGAWLLWRWATVRRPGALGALAACAGAGALAVALAGAQLLPTAELLRESSRAEAAEYEFVMTYSFSPWRLLTQLAPDLLGNPARGRFYGYGNYLEDAVYVGVLPCLLALGVVAGLLRPRGRREPLPMFLAVLLPVTLALALGRNTPLFPWLYAHIPTFDMFQAPTRMMVWWVFALALLGGWGADRWEAPVGRGLYWTRLGAAGAVSIALTCVAALVVVRPETEIGRQVLTVAGAVLVTGLLLLLAAGAALLKPALPGWGWQVLVTACLAGDLVYANAGLNPPAAADVYRAPTPTGAVLRADLDGRRLFYFPEEEAEVKFEPYFSFFTYGDSAALARGARAVQLPNVGVLEGVASANNFDPLVPARYLDYVRVVSATRDPQLLALMNVGAVASRTPIADWRPLTAAEAVTFYAAPVEAQRAWLVPAAGAVIVADGAAARAALTAGTVDPARTVLLEAADAGTLPVRPYPGLASAGDPNAFVWEGVAETAGWLVVADTYYPGWAAYVDGQPTPLRRANYAFRAVAVPAGAHRVEFRYQPRAFEMGLALSAVGLVGWLGLGAWGRRRPRPTS